jgi:hypothetical protein
MTSFTSLTVSAAIEGHAKQNENIERSHKTTIYYNHKGLPID